MKVMILANNDIGLYKFRKELIEELLKANMVYICLPYGEYVDRLMEMGCEFIDCNLLDRRGKNPFRDLKLLSWYKEILQKIKPDIVLTYTIKPNVYGGMACGGLNIPYIANVTGLGSALENKGPLQLITLNLYRAGLKKCKKVFFQNTDNCEFMLRHKAIKGSFDILPGSGVNIEQYKLLAYPENDTIDFLFISRVMRQKGIEEYLKAAEAIRERHPNTRFHICGFCEKEYEGSLEELNRQGVIIYHGLVDDMIAMQKISSCTIHPTFYPEGMSNVLLESIACGRPIITTDRAGCKEIIEDGINGFVVRQQDSRDLIEKIEKFLDLSIEERRAMGLAGREKAVREFDRKIVIDKYLNEIKQIGI